MERFLFTNLRRHFVPHGWAVHRSIIGLTLIMMTGVGCWSGCSQARRAARPAKAFPSNMKLVSARDTQSLVQRANVKLQSPACVEKPTTGYDLSEAATMEPYSAARASANEFWDLSLDEAITIALSNSEVMRDLGGQVINNPDATPDRYQVGIVSSDPRFGVQAALAAFDAQVQSRMFFQKNDRVFNNNIAGLGVNEFRQDLLTWENGITKRTATGAQFSLLQRSEYDSNNSTNNLFPSAFNTNLDATARIPLLRGAGTTFNRIAGPDAQPGFFLAQGVLLARVNEDITAADFEKGVTQFVNDLETSYWELHYAYRQLEIVDATRKQTSTLVEEVTESVRDGADEGFRQLAAEVQLHTLDDQYQSALVGAAAGGSSVGVYRGERNLRWLMGLPPTDGRLIRPADAPSQAAMTFDWQTSVSEAISRRVELRRQQWVVKKKQLELTASKNFVLPQLDAFATYRVRGFGDHLMGNGSGAGNDRFSSAWRNLGTFDYQEIEGGVEFSMPVGYRQGWSAVRNAKLQLSRAQAVLKNQSERVLSDLSQAIAEADRTSLATEINYRRLVTAKAYHKSIELAWENDGPVSVESRLDAINQIAAAEAQFYRSVVEQAIATKNVHMAKGSLLNVNGVILSESAWPCCAHSPRSSVGADWSPVHWSPVPCRTSDQATGPIGGNHVDQTAIFEPIVPMAEHTMMLE